MTSILGLWFLAAGLVGLWRICRSFRWAGTGKNRNVGVMSGSEGEAKSHEQRRLSLDHPDSRFPRGRHHFWSSTLTQGLNIE
jgi:hypothetical protein